MINPPGAVAVKLPPAPPSRTSPLACQRRDVDVGCGEYSDDVENSGEDYSRAVEIELPDRDFDPIAMATVNIGIINEVCNTIDEIQLW